MSTALSPLLAPMLSSAAMRAVCDDGAYLQRMLDFEAALARTEAAAGASPANAAGPIAKACKASSFDLVDLAEAATRSGNLAIPLVKALTANVAKADADAARYVHWGATSQDVIDTAGMLTLRAAIDALLPDLDRAIAGFAKLARQHRNTAVVARTWLQHALPMPFGLKLAEYAAALHRSRMRLQRLRSEGLALQFGGAAGTLAALGDKGMVVAEKLAQELKLPLPDAPWHTHRDRIAEAASVFAVLTGTCGKIARDVSLMMQTDVAEAFEPSGEGRGGSSTMPHKRNPVAAATALAALPRRRSPRRPWRRTWRRRFSPPRCRTTSAAPGHGRRNGRPCRVCCWSRQARSRRSLTSPKGCKSMLRACAPISRRRAG